MYTGTDLREGYIFPDFAKSLVALQDASVAKLPFKWVPWEVDFGPSWCRFCLAECSNIGASIPSPDKISGWKQPLPPPYSLGAAWGDPCLHGLLDHCMPVCVHASVTMY